MTYFSWEDLPKPLVWIGLYYVGGVERWVTTYFYIVHSLWGRGIDFLYGLGWCGFSLGVFCDMMIISYMGFGNSTKGKTLWRIACLTLIWMVWQERNARIFEDKWRTFETLWDLFHFFSSLWASCTNDFKGIPLNVIKFSWLLVCTPLGLGHRWEELSSFFFFRRGFPLYIFLWFIFSTNLLV